MERAAMIARVSLVTMLLIASHSQAATPSYEVFVLDAIRHLDQIFSTMLQIDLESRDVDIWPTREYHPSDIATTPDGSLYGVGGTDLLRRYEVETRQWVTYDYPDPVWGGRLIDAVGMPNGNLAVIVDDMGADELDTQTGAVSSLLGGYSDAGPFGLAVSPSGAVISAWTISDIDQSGNHVSRTALALRRPNAVAQERIDLTDTLHAFDYIFESEDTLLLAGNGGVSRLDLNTD
jgi:hypothetical protein